MSLLDRLSGRRRPTADTPRRTDGEVVRALLSLNAPDVPYAVASGADEGADLVAAWRMTEPEWFEVFERSQLTRTFRIFLRLDVERGEVRVRDQQCEVTWARGVPSVSVSRDVQRGLIVGSSTRKATGEPDGGSTVFRFSAEDLEAPLRETVLQAGWGWRPVPFGRL